MFALDNVFRLFSLARGMFALVGLGVVLLAALPAPRGAVLQQAAELAAAERQDDPIAADAALATPAPTPAPTEAPTLSGVLQVAQSETIDDREQRVVAESISRRYRVAEAASTEFVSTAYRAGRELSLDPLLILAVMAVESRYNPVAESSMGAKGLMQVIPRYHPEKLLEHGGEHALLDPEINIEVGAQILREYLRRYGDTEAALQKYAGAQDEPGSPYAAKVLAEKARLNLILSRARREA
ncbi:MAG: transglycosylase SLT domain-containing protein [Burkholderiales bacterium]